MQRDEIRLECIKLAVQRTPDHKEAISRAEDFYDFVMKPAIQEAAVGAKNLAPKKSGNAKDLL